MKISVKNIFFALGATAVMASCGENAWNDHLDGFEPGVNYNNPIEGEFTMSAADYNAVASNSTNKSLAEAAGVGKALKAVGTDGKFSAQVTGKEYLPAFLASSSAPYFVAPEGSKVNVTYQETGVTDPIIAGIDAATEYKISSEEYQAAWKSDKDYIDAFAPMTPASDNIPEILKSGIHNAQDGQYAIVSYQESAENPVFISGGNALKYSESFSEDMGAFVIYNEVLPDGLSYVWSMDAKNGCMKASAYVKGTNYAAAAWLLSPEITLGKGAASFSFDNITNFFADVETAKKEATVWVRVSGGNWEQLTGFAYPEKMSWSAVNSGEIDLSKYSGSTIQIGFKYTSTEAKAGTWEIKNFLLNAEDGTLGENPGFASKPKKALASTPVTAGKTAVYMYNGSKWALAEGVKALCAADYTAMGFSNNKLENPDINLPLYLKANMPYAVAGDMMAVVYNYDDCAVCVYDGQNWTVNNNNLQTLVGQFELKNGAWKFVKYVGKSYFNLTEELILDRQYLMVAEGICAIPLATSKNYGYLNTEAVTDAAGVIEQKNEANAFTFATTATVEGKEYKAADGTFFIIDSNGRFLYMSGSYNSFNVADAPKDGDANYTFKAEHKGAGQWTITNAGNGKWIQYSPNYTSWGCYDTESGVLPYLYVLAAE